jgi:plasmid stability protein
VYKSVHSPTTIFGSSGNAFPYYVHIIGPAIAELIENSNAHSINVQRAMSAVNSALQFSAQFFAPYVGCFDYNVRKPPLMKEMNMANLTIHNIDESITNNLRVLAQQHGQTIEEEVRQILRQTVSESSRGTIGLGSKISKRFTEIGGVELPQPTRAQPRQSASFGETN